MEDYKPVEWNRNTEGKPQAHPDDLVEVLVTLDTGMSDTERGKVRSFNWDTNLDYYPITHYRIVKKYQEWLLCPDGNLLIGDVQDMSDQQLKQKLEQGYVLVGEIERKGLK